MRGVDVFFLVHLGPWALLLCVFDQHHCGGCGVVVHYVFVEPFVMKQAEKQQQHI